MVTCVVIRTPPVAKAFKEYLEKSNKFKFDTRFDERSNKTIIVIFHKKGDESRLLELRSVFIAGFFAGVKSANELAMIKMSA